MADNEPNNSKSPKLADFTHSFSWEVAKEDFRNCNLFEYIESPVFTININGFKSEWSFLTYPKGREEEDMNTVRVYLFQESKNEIYKVNFGVSIETQDGYWPDDYLLTRDFPTRHFPGPIPLGYADDDSEVTQGCGYRMCLPEEFEKHFLDNKVTLVATLVIYLDDDKYHNGMKAGNQFMDNMRSISSQQNLTDFTIISGDKHFPCHRVLLAVRSEYFEALFRNEPSKTELKVEEAPELVEIVLEFIFNGLIPKDIDDKAMDLILLADMYGLDILAIACETSLINNLSPDNAVETLITIDKVKHVSKQKNRLKVLTYINKEADKVAKSKDWKKFVQNYPNLITEAFLLKCSKSNPHQKNEKMF